MNAKEIAKIQDRLVWSEEAMANIPSKDSGIPGVFLYASVANSQHAFRIKVSNVPGKMSDDTFSLSKDGKILAGECKLSSKEIKQIVAWINLNWPALLEYWEGKEESTKDFLNKLKPLESKKDKIQKPKK